LAFHSFTPPLDTTAAQTFTFAKSDKSRVAQLNMFFSSVSGSASGDHGFRPSAIEVTVGEVTTVYDDYLDSRDKDEWDTSNLDIAIPENDTTLTVQAISVDNEPLNEPGLPASFAWNAAAFSIEKSDEICGRMEGRGKIRGTRTRHNFSISCDVNEPNRLQISWIKYNKYGKYGRHYGQSNSFYLTALDTSVCSDDPNIKQQWNSSSFDTLYGKGTGRYNGQNGAKVEFTFVDGGSSYGRRDIAEITITDNKGAVVLKESGLLGRGNYRAQDCSSNNDCYSSNYPKYNQRHYYRNNYYGYNSHRNFRRWK
jgi:hypothetical protein